MSLAKFETSEEYNELDKWFDDLRTRSKDEWADAMRWYAKNDLYYLFTRVMTLGRAIHSEYGTYFHRHDVYVQACRQYERQIERGGGSVDSSCRRASKSEIRSCGVPIYLMLNHPNISMCLFSSELKLANRHMVRMMNELSNNRLLLFLFPDLFYQDPREESKTGGLAWSKTDGLVIKGRTINRSTGTFEVNALYGGGPVGSGYDAIFADDIETTARIGTKEAIDDMDAAFSAAVSLLTPVVLRRPIVMVHNTRFSQAGLIHRIYERYKLLDEDRVRAVPGEDVDGITDYPDHWYTGYGPLGGRAVYPNTPELLQMRYDEVARKEEYILQYGLSYKSVSDRALRADRINYYTERPQEMAKNCMTYLCIDPSRGKVDPMCLWVWGLTPDQRFVWLDSVVRKLDPTEPEFHDTLFRVANQWDKLSERMVEIRVEDTPNSTWAELIEGELRDRGCYIPVRKVRAVARQAQGKFKTGKQDRIYDHWAPMINNGVVWFPKPMSKGGKGIFSADEKGTYRCLVDYFHQFEFDTFPVSKTDNMLDAGALIAHAKTNEEFPLQYGTDHYSRQRRLSRTMSPGSGSWMSALG